MNRHEALGLAPYHRSAGTVVMFGVIGGLLFASLGVPYPWVGFFVGSVPVFLILAVHHTREEAAWEQADRREVEK